MIRLCYLASMMDNLGGAERVNFQVLTRLHAAGFSSHAIFLKKAGEIGEKLVAHGVDIFSLGGKGRGQFLTLLRQTLQTLTQRSIDVLFTGEDRLAMAIASIARRKGVVRRYVVAFHNTRLPYGIGKLVHPIAVRIADACVVLSERNKRFWQQHYRLPEGKLWVIPNGIPLSQTQPLPANERASLRILRGLAPERFTVGLVTFFKDFKNLPGFVRVARRVVDSGVDAQFVLAGDGPEREHVEETIQELGLQDRFLLPGKVSASFEWYQLCDVALMTSSSSEAFPLTLIEAMACGLPVVATDIAGIPDIVVHGATGFLASPTDLETLARYVVLLAKDSELRQRLGEAGRQRALMEFNADVMISRYAQMFRTVVSQ
ncbi:MAG: glycosyltransferase family 4 protein [Armatimonadota bacterium]|nr:glycosyltransferase family 4 protein [Armatimonadota bacterium]